MIKYIVMVEMDEDTIPLSGKIHTSQFQAFLEMEHAKDNPMFAGYRFYIRRVER